MLPILLAANWKMQGNEKLLHDFATYFTHTPPPEHIEVVLCVPFVYLPLAQKLFKQTTIRWGAQDVSPYQPGAYTGQISAQMLSEFVCRYVIIGHSERRALCGESDNLIAEKFKRLHELKLLPILCIGETQEQRAKGETDTVIHAQLSSIIEQVGIDAFHQAVIAYEPIWAIGTGNAAKPEDVEVVHNQIYHYLAQQNEAVAETVRVIYGGSMNENNVRSLITLPSVAGGLVGGASLKLDSFSEMIIQTNRV